MALSKEARLSKLRKLAEIEGYASTTALLEASAFDVVSPAICTNEGCDYTVEMEPDQAEGWCDECRRNSVASALVLADII
jgi:hypothetical protein